MVPEKLNSPSTTPTPSLTYSIFPLPSPLAYQETRTRPSKSSLYGDAPSVGHSHDSSVDTPSDTYRMNVINVQSWVNSKLTQYSLQ